MNMRPLPKAALLAICALNGGYMLFDGIHHVLTGSYFGGQIGPWAALPRSVGVDPASMAPIFIALGALWLLAAAALLVNRSWARKLLTGLSAVSLAYLVFGTILSVVALSILAATRGRHT